jgi:transposase
MAGDKGYSSKAIRDWLIAREVIPVISHRSSEHARDDEFDRESYRERNAIERCIGKLKEQRRIATHYEKLGDNYMGMFKLAVIRLYLKAA